MNQKTNAMIIAVLIIFQAFIFGNRIMNDQDNTYETEPIIIAEETEPETEPKVELVTDHYELYLATREIIPKTDEDVSEAEVLTNDTISLSDYEINLISLVTMAEAEGESDEGKRLVIDTILNRVDSQEFPNSVYEVIYQPTQFSSMWNGRINVCYVQSEIRDLVIEELNNRYNYNVIFFRTKYYSEFGVPMFQVGNHYFSSL